MKQTFAKDDASYLSRRRVLGGAADGIDCAFRRRFGPRRATTMIMTLLGTGSPRPNVMRFSAVTLVQAGPSNMLFDVGRGCAIRLGQINVPLGSIGPLFHSDHLVGLPDLWITRSSIRLLRWPVTMRVRTSRLRLLHELVPKAGRIAVLVNPANASINRSALRNVQDAASIDGLLARREQELAPVI